MLKMLNDSRTNPFNMLNLTLLTLTLFSPLTIHSHLRRSSGPPCLWGFL